MQKFKLEELEVESFATALTPKERETINGGDAISILSIAPLSIVSAAVSVPSVQATLSISAAASNVATTQTIVSTATISGLSGVSGSVNSLASASAGIGTTQSAMSAASATVLISAVAISGYTIGHEITDLTSWRSDNASGSVTVDITTHVPTVACSIQGCSFSLLSHC